MDETLYKNVEDADRGIMFADRAAGFAPAYAPGRVLHILCVSGGMSFTLNDVRYNVGPHDYVILPDAALASDFTESADAAATVMSLSEEFVTSLALRSNYGIIGHLSLLQNPVMRLSEDDFATCREAMQTLRRRMDGSVGHQFRDEMLSHLLMAHVLDLYDIHARGRRWNDVPESTQRLLRRFVEMLYSGEYIVHRDMEYYASRLCITPNYLSDVCRKASGRSATYWIDRFTLGEVTRLLMQKDLSLSDITERMNFSSLSYFSRYVQRHTGLSPSDYRRSHALTGGATPPEECENRKK